MLPDKCPGQSFLAPTHEQSLTDCAGNKHTHPECSNISMSLIPISKIEKKCIKYYVHKHSKCI